jgi:hypothetical protein
MTIRSPDRENRKSRAQRKQQLLRISRTKDGVVALRVMASEIVGNTERKTIPELIEAILDFEYGSRH